MKKSDDKRYAIALEKLMDVIRRWPCNPVGGYWHKMHHVNEMWLDGLYMAGPLEAEYSATFGEQCYIETAIEQIILMRDHIQDPETKLLYHAWDPTKEIDWADAETGLSEEFWGRALGWYVVAILDILELLYHLKKKYYYQHLHFYTLILHILLPQALAFSLRRAPCEVNVLYRQVL